MSDDTNQDLIARPGQSLHDHLVNVASLTAIFADGLGLPTAGKLIGAIHDIGKASSIFQKYIRSTAGICDPEDEEYVDASGLRGKIDHSTAGAQHLWRAVQQPQPKTQDMLFAQMLALCICSHHSGLIDCLGSDGQQTYKQRMDKSNDTTPLKEVLAKFGPSGETFTQQLLLDTIQEMRQRLVSVLRPESSPRCGGCRPRGQMACRIANPRTWFSLGLMTRMIFSCLIDADRIDSADIEHPENVHLRSSAAPNWIELINRLEAKLSEFSASTPIDHIRREVSA